MTAIVNGHGSRIDDTKTFVPVGTTLKFYAGFDMDLSTSVNLIALAQGTFANPVQEVKGTGSPDDIENYQYTAEDASFYAKWYAMGGEASLDIWWVGDSIETGSRLCQSPEACLQAGKHTCNGVLGLIEDPEIVILACRGYVGDEDTAMTTTYGSNPDDPLYHAADEAYAEIQRLLTLAQRDPDAAEAEVRGFPQEKFALYVNDRSFDAWLMAWTAKEYANDLDVEQLVGHLRANRDKLAQVGDYLHDIPTYGQAVDRCATTAPEIFTWWVDSQPDEAVEAFLGRRTVVADLLRRVRAENQGLQPGVGADNPAPAPNTETDTCPNPLCGHPLAEHNTLVGCTHDGCSCMAGSVDDD